MLYMKKCIKPFLKKNISKISEIIKQFTIGKKIILSFIFKMFECLLSNNETPKRRLVENLVYKALKLFPKLAFTLLRTFAVNEFNNDFDLWLKKSDSYKSKNKIKVRIDSTFTGRKYGTKIPSLKKLYDYVNNCYIKTHTLYILLLSIGNKDFIVDFELSKKDRKERGSNKVCKDMLSRLINTVTNKDSFFHYCRLSLDGAWGNGDMLNWLSEKGFNYVSIKSGGKDLIVYKDGIIISLKDLERFLSTKNEYYKQFNPKHNLEGDYFSITVKLYNTGLPIRIVLRRFISNRKGYRYLMLVSPNTAIYDYQIAQSYEGRWGIEDCIKSNKQITKIQDYSYHSEKETNIEMFLSLRFCLYMILNWYRVEYCKPKCTSLYKLEERFKYYLNSIGYKEMWKLFSG